MPILTCTDNTNDDTHDDTTRKTALYQQPNNLSPPLVISASNSNSPSNNRNSNSNGNSSSNSCLPAAKQLYNDNNTSDTFR